jgi:hypothetical protein
VTHFLRRHTFLHCHRPLHAGDPIFLFEKKKWVARTSRAMTRCGDSNELIESSMRQEKSFSVYILASKPWGTLYIGVTSDLQARIYQHKKGFYEGFTKNTASKRLYISSNSPSR